MIAHDNAVPHGWYVGEVTRVTERDRVLHALPLSGTWGGLCIPLSTFSHGGALVLMDHFEPAVALRLVEAERITVWNGVDAMAMAVLEHPDLDKRDRSSLRTGGWGTTGGGVHGIFEAEVLAGRWRPALNAAIDAAEVDRHELTTELLLYASAQLFGVAEKEREPKGWDELAARLAQQRAAHRRDHLEQTTF